MTSASPRGSQTDETPRARTYRRLRRPAAYVGLVSGVVLAAVYLLPMGDTGDWILQQMPVIVCVAVATTIIAALAGLGVAPAAAHHGTILNRVLRLFVFSGHVIPALWVALALSTTMMTGPSDLVMVRYVPLAESATGWLVSLAVPLAALTLGSSAALACHIAQSSSGWQESDLVRTLLGRGLPSGYIFRRHVLPRSLPSSATLLALHFLGLIFAMISIDAVVVRELGPAQAVAVPDASPVIMVVAVVVVMTTTVHLARTALVSMMRSRRAAW